MVQLMENLSCVSAFYYLKLNQTEALVTSLCMQLHFSGKRDLHTTISLQTSQTTRQNNIPKIYFRIKILQNVFLLLSASANANTIGCDLG